MIRKVGNCRIVREIGRGGMGVVYEAEQEGLGRRVAIKELPSPLANNAEFADRFRREGVAYAQLNHQYVIAVYDLIEKGDGLYLVTEFVDGCDLQKLLNKSPLPPSVVAIVGARVAEALDHAHFHKLLHRDVKPANIMLSRTGKVKLTDFGIARDLKQQALTQQGMLVGSLPYMAPEVLAGGEYSRASDTWALGVTLYELLVGRRPFNGKDDSTLAAMIMKGKFLPLSKLHARFPRRLVHIIEKCLERKPEKRFRSAGDVARALHQEVRDLLQGATPAGPFDPAHARAWLPDRRRSSDEHRRRCAHPDAKTDSRNRSSVDPLGLRRCCDCARRERRSVVVALKMAVAKTDWSPRSWREKSVAQRPPYRDAEALARAEQTLSELPPLVTPWEIERLKTFIADAQEGRRFWLQGGDCAESLAGGGAESVLNTLKILLQMSLVLIHGGRRPVIRVGRIAGQFAKPRSSPTEVRTVEGVRTELPSYFGDVVNRAAFNSEARAPDPTLLVEAYKHAALTLNYIRSLSAGGFADLHHPENWDLSFLDRAGLPPDLRTNYQRTTERVGEAIRFMEALGEARIEDLSRVEFFTSHEGLLLEYEAAQTKVIGDRVYDLTAHLVWIGERTRQRDGAHVEFFRGIDNPVGVKVGPSADPKEIVALVQQLNPDNSAGKIVLIPRFGASHAEKKLPALVEALAHEKQHVLWVCDPMHGNTKVTASGIKTRHVDDIVSEIEAHVAVHQRTGTLLGGVHLELTGDDVTECVGAGTDESDLQRNYASLCDPRLNYRQALEVAYRLDSVARVTK